MNKFFLRNKNIFVLSTLLLAFLGCSFKGPGSVKELSEEYQTIRGGLAAPPLLEKGDKRLFLYIVREEPIEGEKEILVCVATNDDNKRLLTNLAKRTAEIDEPLFLFARPVEGKWEEYIEGVDFEIFAVGYYNPSAKRYTTVVTTYGDKFLDVVRSVGWGEFLSQVGKRAIKSAL